MVSDPIVILSFYSLIKFKLREIQIIRRVDINSQSSSTKKFKHFFHVLSILSFSSGQMMGSLVVWDN